MEIKNLVRKNILNLQPYSCARNEFKGEARVLLDANESPYNSPYNRYPDPLQIAVKEKLANIKGVKPEQIFLGVGSDECIDLVYRVFCVPGVDNVVAIDPSYGMYEVCADINDVEYRRVPLTDDFGLDIEALISATDAHTKAMWICSPNNPTGNAFSLEEIEAIYRCFNGILVVDEAYIHFSAKGSMLSRLDKMPRLIVLHTLSKAWGSAAVRLGMAFASTEIISIFNNVKYPYNINLLTQQYVLNRLEHRTEVEEQVQSLLDSRKKLEAELAPLPFVLKVYPSDANFLLVRTTDADGIYRFLIERGVIVRNRNRVSKCLGCLRITVGTPDENNDLIENLKQYGK